MGDTRRGVGGGRHVHLCRVVDDRTALRAEAVTFLADGLARGLRVCYIAEGDDPTLEAELAPLRDLPGAGRPGAIEIRPVERAYPGAAFVVDVETQVRASVDDTRAAVADGFAGFRTVADCTPFVRTAEQLEAVARLEYRIDRLMTTIPFSAFCGLRRDELDDDTIAQLACLHPDGSAEHAPFRLHASPDATAALSGELDVSTVALFATALDRTGLHDAGAEVVIDATRLDFADHRNLFLLEELGHRHDRSVVLRTDRRVLHRLVAALRMSRVRVEHAAAGVTCSFEH